MRRLLLAAIAITLALPLSATESNPSPRQRELIEKLLQAVDMDATLHSTLDAMYKQIEKQFLDRAAAEGNDPDSVAEAKELFATFRERAAKINLGGEMHESYVRMYAKYLTDDEIIQITAFHTSPAGRKALAIMPQLMQEAMQASSEHLGPKIEQAMREAIDAGEQKRPWRRTMSDMRTVATAVEAYAIDHDDKYPGGDYASLKALLVPTYLEKFPEKDMWNDSYAWVISDDHLHYRIVSAGADSNFEWDSRRIVPTKADEERPVVYRDNLQDDLIYADGSFVQLPVQAKPKPAPTAK